MSDVLDRLKRRARELGARLAFPVTLPTSPRNDGSAHAEEHEGELYYVVTERGGEFERRATRDEDELLYWFISAAVFDAACTYEAAHRVSGQDNRRLMFQKELELLQRIDDTWANRRRAEIEEILSRNPYHD